MLDTALPPNLVTTLAATAVLTLVSVAMLWLVSVARRNASIVDIYWGPGFLGICAMALVLNPPSPRAVLVTSLVGVWSLRLALHIGWRNCGEPEDFRYAAMRRKHGTRFAFRSLFTVFGLQGVLMWLLSLPLQVSIAAPATPRLTALDLVAVALWTAGLLFEAVGDWQLARFRADPAHRGRVLNRGLWSTTRHPNYFGEALLWWGYGLVALSAAGPWVLISPALMTFLLVKVSGAALLERGMEQRRPEYAEYMATTSAFLPRLRRGKRTGATRPSDES